MDNNELRGFVHHGVTVHNSLGNQAVCDCVFCGKPKKLYINKDNKLWDCKVCGETGNFEGFLQKVSANYKEQMYKKALIRLSESKELPIKALKGLGIGLNKAYYMLPVPTLSGKITDIRRYKLDGKLMSTPSAKLGILFIKELMDPERKEEPVYVCEGEWDAIAWRYLLNKLSKKGVVIGIPGAGVFKSEWASYFSGRNVRILYDNDQAGIDGEIRVYKTLNGHARNISCLHWAEDFDTGYDVRDLVKDSLKLGRKHTKRAYKMVIKALNIHTRSTASFNPSGDKNVGIEEGEAKPLKPISPKELILEYRKWLHLPNTDVIKIMYGSIIANQLGGDPVWLFLVAPPGGSKSELLMSLSESNKIHTLTSLTPHTLISGINWKDNDPSLLPQLNDKIMVIKDFTAILTMHYSIRDEIFGTLRDIYDGNTEKAFGNGVKRSYNVKFGVLAGVTPVIETFNILHSSLGERFLKFRITGNWDLHSEEIKIRKALDNIGKESSMRSELKVAANRYLQNMKLDPKLPIIKPKVITKIVALAKFCARLRGVVDREKYSQQVLYKPSSEVGTRIAKQLTKLGSGIAIFMGQSKINKSTYKLMKRVALDTVPDRTEDVVRAMWELCKNENVACSTPDIVAKTRLPQSTIFRILQDLNLLRIVDKIDKKSLKSEWKLNKIIRNLIISGKIYGKEDK